MVSQAQEIDQNSHVTNAAAVRWWLGLCLAAALIFSLWPGLDLWLSDLLRQQLGHGQFLPKHGGLAGFIYQITEILAWLIALSAGLVWLLCDYRGRPLGPLNQRAAGFLLSLLVLAPGLITNELLKDHWGRARPSQISDFGGTQAFSPALVPASACDDNCSFPGGHAAMAFSTLGLALLVRGAQRRRRALLAATVFGAVVSLGRISQGGHFLSDCLFAGLITWGVALWLHHGFFTRRWWPQLDRPGRAAWADRLDQAIIEDGWIGAPAALLGWTRRWQVQLIAVIGLLIGLSMLYVDRAVAQWVTGLNPEQQMLFRLITDAGKSGPYIIGGLVGALALWLLARRLPHNSIFERAALLWLRRCLFLTSAVIGSGLTVQVLKAIFGRPRPKLFLSEGAYSFGFFEVGGKMASFPSGHSTTAATVAMVIIMIWPRSLVLVAPLAIMVAGTRILVGAHYPSDVLAGLCLGVVYTLWWGNFWQIRKFGPLRGDGSRLFW